MRENLAAGDQQGVPGVASNLPDKTSAVGRPSQSLSEKKNDTINYEINKVISHVI